MRCLLLPWLVLTLLGCGGSDPVPSQVSSQVSSQVPATSPEIGATLAAEASAEHSRQTESEAIKVLFLGDSLSAGFGLASEEAFPALVEKLLTQQGIAVEVINAGVSGDTSAGGLARIGWLLRQQPDIVVVELGGNDGLRGLAPEVTEENLRRTLQSIQAAGAQVLLAGMQMPPNYGADYQRRFAALYPKLAKELDVALIPFLLEGVGGDPNLNQADGIHPTAEGQRLVAQTVSRHLAKMLQ